MKRVQIAIITAMLGALLVGQCAANDELLKRYVNEALLQNLQIEMSRSDVEIARRDRDAAASAFYPTAGFDYRHTRVNREISLDIPLNIPGFEAGSVLSKSWQWQAAFSGRVPLYLGGRLRHNLGLRDAVLKGSEIGVDIDERDVALQVIQGYLDLKMALALEVVQGAALETAKEHQRSVQAMLDQGMVSLRELKRAEAVTAEAESELIAAGNAAQRARRAFNYVLNRDLETEVDASAEPQWGGEYDLAEAIEKAVQARPELAALQQRLLAGNKQIDLARSDYYPNFSLAAEGGWRDGDIMAMGGRDYWQVSVLAGLTLFDATREDKIAAARASRRREGLLLESTRKRIELQVTDSYLRLVDARKQLSASEREVSAAEEAQRVAELQFEQGVVNQVTYLDAEFALISAGVRNEQARFKVWKAEAALRHAAGYPLP